MFRNFIFILEIQLCGNTLDSEIHLSVQMKTCRREYHSAITSHHSTGKQLAWCCLLCVNNVVVILWSTDVNYPCPWEITMKKKQNEKTICKHIYSRRIIKNVIVREGTRKTSHARFTLNFKNLSFKISFLEDVLCVCLIQKSYWDIVETVTNHSHLQSCCLGKSAHTLATENSVTATLYFWMCSM